MSALQKSIMKSKLPPLCPKPASGKMAPFGMARRKDYSPVPWQQYFEKYMDVEAEGGTFRVYLSPEPDHSSRPRLVTLHGGGYSGLSWALFTEEITNMIHCQVISMDIRGHGETQADNPEDLSADTLVKDVEQVLHKLFGEELPPIVLVGHSMGGAVAVRAALLPSLEPYVHGIAVIDVVEGTAMDALASMQSFLRGRPTHFRATSTMSKWFHSGSATVTFSNTFGSCPAAQSRSLVSTKPSDAPWKRTTGIVLVPRSYAGGSATPVSGSESCLERCRTTHRSSAELRRTRAPPARSQQSTRPIGASRGPATKEFSWCISSQAVSCASVRSGQVRNVDSAKVSMPSQIVNSETNRLATNELDSHTPEEPHAPAPMPITPAADCIAEEPEDGDVANFTPPPAPTRGDGDTNMRYKWRIDLSKTERYWSGWFQGLSSRFLSVRAPRLLLLASIEGLDRELTIGQMQGKFQMQVLTRCGHAVHEDTPGEVARVIAAFLLRHRVTEPTPAGEHLNLVSAPGC
ncbi:protein phosphatase methylesterase 1 [Leguminivora glycinivorella]|uniref:protein phosphatase methylesterase 1 n=1 Tax=Leguminivora glycinivorella TaxID=1035111 RepID=UPI00200DDCC0|nr:protein phosphatase methylesterase 1 [Leguminivora glycinivorella]